MFIIWGTKKVLRKLGFVAEICPRCCGARSVKVSRVAMASHIFFLPFGGGQLLGFSGECQTCSGVFEVHPLDYAAFEKNRKTSVEQLINTTNPKLQPNNERAVASFKRASTLRDPLLRFNKSLEDRYGRGTRLDLRSGLAFLATFVIPITIGIYKSSLPVSAQVKDLIGDFSLVFFVGGLVASFVVLYGEPKRFFAGKLLPEIVRELRPLHPQYAEIESCLDSMKKHGYRIAGYVKAQELLNSVRGLVGEAQQQVQGPTSPPSAEPRP